MEWFVVAAPIPGAVECGVIGLATQIAGFVAALVPVLIVARYTLVGRLAAVVAPQLRVIEGGKELSRHAA